MKAMIRGAMMIRLFRYGFPLCVLCVLCGESCFADPPKGKVTFDQQVAPILRDKCLGCHNPDKTKGGLDLSNFTKTLQGGASGAVVKPGDPDGSRLFALVSHKEMPYMPPQSPPIAKESLDTLRAWIQGGALENAGSKPVAVKPKADVSLVSVKRGKPDGPPPMPEVKLKLEPIAFTPKANAVVALAASPWAPLVAVGGQKGVLLYHGDTLQLLGVLPFNYGTPQVLKFSRNGSLLLAGGGRGGHSGKVVVWNVKTGEPIIEAGNETDAVLAADISADQTLIALGGPNKMIRIYSTKDGSLVREIKKHTDWVYAIEFSPDAVLLATADRSGGLFVWESATGREFYNLRGHTGPILDVSWRDDSNVLASASEDSTIRLWEMENGTQIKNWGAHGGGAQSVKFSHDNRLVSTGRDRVTKVWDQNGAQQRAFEALPDVGLRAAFSHDGAKIYAGDWTGQVKAWLAADGKPLGAMTTNPPPAAQRLEIARTELKAKEAAFNQANAAWTSANTNAQKAAAELAATQKQIADTAAAAKAATDALPGLKAKLDQANAVAASAQMAVQARDLKAKAFAEAAAKLKAAADAATTNVELVNAAAGAKQLADQAAAELAAGQKALNDAQNAANQATAAFAAGQKAISDATAAHQAANQALPAKQQAAKAAADALPALKTGLDNTAAELNALKGAIEPLQAAVAAAPPKS
jgi:Planctomycete cytochrome C/WD domain, G-beta repeat